MTYVYALITIAVVLFALKRFNNYCFYVKSRNNIEVSARNILDSIHRNHPEFFDVSKGLWIKEDSNVELEFRMLHVYRKVFNKMNVTLREAGPALQAKGYSHYLDFYGNVFPVRNYVDVTGRVVRLA